MTTIITKSQQIFVMNNIVIIINLNNIMINK